jgi:hypothetical protein
MGEVKAMTWRVGAAVSAVFISLSFHVGAGASAFADDQGGLCSPNVIEALHLSTWRPPAPHGFHEFRENVTLEAPRDMAMLVVELWGGGGGGGGGSIGSIGTRFDAGSGGGGGASGSYARGTFAAIPARRYTLIVGRGGPGGASAGRSVATAGQDGGDSYVCDAGALVLRARGGSGGQPSPGSTKAGAKGRGSLPELAPRIVATTLLKPGEDGHDGSMSLFDSPGSGGVGGRTVVGSIKPTEAWGGDGAGGGWPESRGDGKRGGEGSIILAW